MENKLLVSKIRTVKLLPSIFKTRAISKIQGQEKMWMHFKIFNCVAYLEIIQKNGQLGPDLRKAQGKSTGGRVKNDSEGLKELTILTLTGTPPPPPWWSLSFSCSGIWLPCLP